MKLPLSWLREWVDLPDDPQAVAVQLTSLGFEVEALERVAPEFSGVVVAEIVGVAAHPQADKLRVCTVNAGEGELLQIVCGAPNARAGLRTALAQVGAVLPGELRIKAAKLRGVESAGMLCSASELGLNAEHDGIMELPADAPLGQSLRTYLDLDDWTLEIGITPNRGDAMSVLGIARELAAASGKALRHPVGAASGTVAGTGAGATAVTSALTTSVRLTPGAGCGRFASRIIEGIRTGVSSPRWLQERLRRSGLRSISPVVDVTNYVVLELGQPMHAYDRARLQGTIVARSAHSGEAVTLLDGRALQVDADVLAIADDGGIVGLAGIMGGERTAIGDDTRDLLLEVAWFDPAAIAGRARRYGLLTDASQRFERGVDPALPERALERATGLILSLVGGAAGPVNLQELPGSVPTRDAVTLRPERVVKVLGVPLTADAIRAPLQALGMTVASQAGALQVTPPSWRFDIRVEADLIEEVARSIGLGAIPEQPAAGLRRLRAAPEAHINERVVLQLMAARGFQEVVSFGFVDPALQTLLLGGQPAVALRNPIASDLAVMRLSLWPGLINAALQNLRRQQDRCKLFEVASVFRLAADGKLTEMPMVGGLAVGSRLPEQWGVPRAGLDFHDLKADIQTLLTLGGPDSETRYEPLESPPPALHPGRSAAIMRDGVRVGLIGELHPNLVRKLEFAADVLLFEIDWCAVTTVRAAQYKTVSQFPQIRRDISFTVDETESFSHITEHVSVAASGRLKELRVFDIYAGKGVEIGRKSVALGLILQDLSRTLTDEEADAVVAAVVTRLKTELNAKLRE